MRQAGVSESAVRAWWRDRQRWAEYYHSHPEHGKTGLRRAGCNTSLTRLPSKSAGKRLAKAGRQLGRTDHCRPFVQGTQVFSEPEASYGFTLGRQDLLREFKRLLELGIKEAREAEAEGTLTPELQKSLAHSEKKAQSLQKTGEPGTSRLCTLWRSQAL